MCAVCALCTTAGVRPYLGSSREIARSTPNSAKNTGSWATTGRHPASGLAPFSLYSFIVSSLSFCLSPLYFFFSSATCGASAVIFLVACICLMNSGTRISRMMITRKMIVRAQVQPLDAPKIAPNNAVQAHDHPGDRFIERIKQRDTHELAPCEGGDSRVRRGGTGS